MVHLLRIWCQILRILADATISYMKKITGEKIILVESSGPIKFPNYYLQHFHTHILCNRGSMHFVFNEKQYSAEGGEFIFWFADSNLGDVRFSNNFKANVLFVEKDFLDNNIPDQSWSIDVILHS